VLVPALAFAAAFLTRSVAGALVEGLRRELWLTDQALGTLVTVFAAAAAVSIPAFAALGGRVARPRLLAAALLLCGTGTALSAAAGGFWSLVATRVLAGAGAGGAAVVAAGLVAAARPGPGRTTPVLLLAAPFGLALGYLAGGAATAWQAWRTAFAAAGAGPIVLALACWGLVDRPRPDDPWSALHAEGTLRTARRVLSSPGAAAALAAAAVGAAAVTALVFWLPAFLERARGVPRSFAGGQLCAAVLAGGIAGALLGRALVDEIGRRVRAPAGWVAAGGAGVAALAVAAALGTLSPVVYLPAVMVALLASFAAVRAAVIGLQSGGAGDPAASALAVLVLHGVGELSGAAALGAVADRTSFRFSLVLLPAGFAAAGALWVVATWRRQRRLSAVSGTPRTRGAA
jgi:predicted MFS family arabinose efflux permease